MISRMLREVPSDPKNLFDVIAVDLETCRVRVMNTKMTERNAEAYVCMAVARRGVDKEFFAAVPTGRWKNGDKYTQGA